MATSTELTLRQKTDHVIATLELPAVLQQIEESLPENVTLDRFKRVTITAIRSNPDLVKADESSLFASIVKCAQDGLFPDGRDAALVIYGKNVQYLPMVGGLRKIAGNYGWAISSQVVREADDFDFEEGLEPKLTHRRPRPGVDRGELVNAYAIAQHKDGRKMFVVLDQAEIEKCRAVSRAKDNGPWVQWTERMWEKTAAKRLFKQLPISDRELVDRVLAADVEPADAAEMLYGPDGRAALATSAPPADAPAATPTETLSTHDDGATGSGDGQQTEAAGPPAASVPDPDEDEQEPVLFKTGPDLAVAAAELEDTKIPAALTGHAGVNQGRTLAEVADAGYEGEQWFGYAYRHPAKFPEAFNAVLHTYLQGAKPELWAELTAEQAA